MANSIYICPNCKKSYKAQGNDKIIKCTQCSSQLIDTHISVEEWSQYNPQKKEEIKHRICDKKDSDELIELIDEPEVSEKNSFFETMKTEAVFCPFCGTENEEGSVFCYVCGKQISQQSEGYFKNVSEWTNNNWNQISQNIKENVSKNKNKSEASIKTNQWKAKIFSLKNVIRVFALLCFLLFFFPNFSIIWRSLDVNPIDLDSSVSGLDYVRGITVYIGWGPNSGHEISGSHPFAFICMLIPVVIFVIMCLRRVSNFHPMFVAILSGVDIIMWLYIRSKVEKLASRNDLFFESTGFFVVNLLLLIAILFIILSVLILKLDISTDFRHISRELSVVQKKAFENRHDNTKRCVNCGSYLSPDSQFCSSCGTPVKTETVEERALVCSYCGTELSKDSLFCNKCGKKIG